MVCWHVVHDLKTAQKNIHYSLIQELTLYEFKLGCNVAEETKNICYTNGEGAVYYWTVSRWLKKICLEYKNLNDPTVDFEAMLQAIEANPVSSILRVSGELSILQSSVVHHLHNSGKSICHSQIVPHVQPKYCKTSDIA